jgi:hypothetical protein
MASPPVVFRGYTAKSLAEQIREYEAPAVTWPQRRDRYYGS